MAEKMTCTQCSMPCDAGEYHPYAACLMFKACHNSETVRANLAQPAQAVDVAAIREVIAELNDYCEAGDGSSYGMLSTTTVRGYTGKLTRAIGNAQAEGWSVPEDMALIPRHYASNIQVAACMMEQSGSVLDRREAPILRKVAAMLASPTTHPGHSKCP